MPDPNNPASYATRNDGTQKDSGFLGPITDSQGNSMTEFSIGVNIDGKETEFNSINFIYIFLGLAYCFIFLAGSGY